MSDKGLNLARFRFPLFGRGAEVDIPGSVRCQVGTGGLVAVDQLPIVAAQGLSSPGPGVGAEFGFLSIEGRLGRQQYRDIAAAAQAFAEGGARRVGVVVDSGGGDLAGLGGAVRSLVELRQALDGNLFTFAARDASSAACALLMTGGSGRVYADGGATVGGLGAVMRLEDDSRLWLEGLLTEVHALTADAPLKTVGQPGLPITEAQLDFELDQVRSADNDFLALVAAARGIPFRDAQRMKGEGGAYHATVAKSLGIVDEITDESAFRALVAGTSQRLQEIGMPLEQPGAPVAPQTATAALAPEASTPDTAGAPPQAATEPTTPVVTTATPAEPAAAQAAATLPEPDQAAPDPAIAALTAQVTALASLVQTTVTAQAQVQKQAQSDGFRARLGACVEAGRCTSAAAEAAQAAVDAMVAAGQDPTAVVASYEALPPISAQANLSEEVTFQVPTAAGTEAHTIQVNLADFGAIPGPNGQVVVNRQAAVETAALLEGAETPRDMMRRLEAAHRQDGGF